MPLDIELGNSRPFAMTNNPSILYIDSSRSSLRNNVPCNDVIFDRSPSDLPVAAPTILRHRRIAWPKHRAPGTRVPTVLFVFLAKEEKKTRVQEHVARCISNDRSAVSVRMKNRWLFFFVYFFFFYRDHRVHFDTKNKNHKGACAGAESEGWVRTACVSIHNRPAAAINN